MKTEEDMAHASLLGAKLGEIEASRPGSRRLRILVSHLISEYPKTSKEIERLVHDPQYRRKLYPKYGL